METVISCVFFVSKAGKFKTSMARVPYNKLLTNLASSSRTGEYWPSVVSVRTSLRSVRTATTSGQYSPVRPSRSVSKRLSHKFHSFLAVGVDIFFLNDRQKVAIFVVASVLRFIFGLPSFLALLCLKDDWRIHLRFQHRFKILFDSDGVL